MMTRSVRNGICVVLGIMSHVAALAQDRPFVPSDPPTFRELSLNEVGKLMCSAHFVTGLSQSDIVANFLPDGQMWYENATPAPYLMEAARSARIDDASGMVTVSDGSYVTRSRYFGEQGCTILPHFRDMPFFKPEKVRSAARPADRLGWVDGGLLAHGLLPPRYDAAKLRAGLALFMSGKYPSYEVVVVHHGRLLAEQYTHGMNKDTPVQNWSMGKIIFGTMIGMLTQRGAFKLDDAAPVPEWHEDKTDLRGKITIRNLLQMRSGLRCTRSQQPDQRQLSDIDDNVYWRALDATRLGITRPVVGPAGEVENYSNCDMQVLGYIIRRTIEGRGEHYASWPYRNLYEKIGMTGMVSELDAYGNFQLTGYDMGTARDWAKLGMLFLNDGVWNGERLLPSNWVKQAGFTEHLKSKLGDGSHAGSAASWFNTDGEWATAPRSAWFAAGGGGGLALFIPEKDLVIVTLGPNFQRDDDRKIVDEAIKTVIDAVPDERK